MRKYTVEYKGRSYGYNGNNTAEVAEKFGNRKAFGRPVIYGLSLKMYDADTRGEQWAEYTCNQDERVFISLATDMQGAIGAYCGGMYPVAVGYFSGGKPDYTMAAEDSNLGFGDCAEATGFDVETLKDIAWECARNEAFEPSEPQYRDYEYKGFQHGEDLIIVPVGGWCGTPKALKKAYAAGRHWAKQAVADGEPGEWDGLNITELRQALANANAPATPTHETSEEDDAFEEGVLSIIKID